MSAPEIKIKTSPYQAWLDRLYESHENNAQKAVSEGYTFLKKEGKNAKEARAIIEHDLGKIWRLDTIQRHLPAECKDENMAAVRSKRTEKQQEEQERRKASYEPLLEELQTLLVGADGTTSQPAISPKTVKRIEDALKEKDEQIERLKRTQPKAGKPAPALDTEVGKLRQKVTELEAQVAPFHFQAKLKIWNRVMTVDVFAQPSIRSGTVALPKKERERTQ